MNVLVIGSGGREHALCHAVSKSKHLHKLYAIPGNPGMKEIAECIDIDPMDNQKIKEFTEFYQIDLIIPGSEVYLENGIENIFEGTSVKVFGPSKEAAQIESSKEFAKDLMCKYNIPTATYNVFDDYERAVKHIENNAIPTVIKYDGLAGGKGVVVATTKQQALDAVKLMLKDRKYGNDKVVIEEYLEGPEFSLMCFVNEDYIIPMPIAQDHKRLLDNDQGPNTGGMGIYSPVPMIPDEVVKDALNHIMIPTIKAMKQEGTPFKGFLYGGLMLTKNGPKVIEFNARFGDPETEVILPQLESDFLEIIEATMKKEEIEVSWNNLYYVGVVLASKGYPNSYEKGYPISGLDTIDDELYHMGTAQKDKQLVTNGGRVLLVTGNGETLESAIDKAYKNVSKVKCENFIYRTDIGQKSLRGKNNG